MIDGRLVLNHRISGFDSHCQSAREKQQRTLRCLRVSSNASDCERSQFGGGRSSGHATEGSSIRSPGLAICKTSSNVTGPLATRKRFPGHDMVLCTN
jgi:hypothetical protein